MTKEISNHYIYKMSKVFPLILATSLLLLMLAVFSCTSDQLPEPTVPESCENTFPTYTDDIKPIIDNSCAYAGCHLGTAPGIYDDYEGVKSVIESGSFRERVVIQKDDPLQGMPPNYAPDGRPKDLSAEELELIECWLDSGYPEN